MNSKTCGQGQLGTVKVTEHRIELEPGLRPVRLPPHRGGHKAREVEKTEVEEMLRLDVTEPASTEWSSPSRHRTEARLQMALLRRLPALERLVSEEVVPAASYG